MNIDYEKYLPARVPSRPLGWWGTGWPASSAAAGWAVWAGPVVVQRRPHPVEESAYSVAPRPRLPLCQGCKTNPCAPRSRLCDRCKAPRFNPRNRR